MDVIFFASRIIKCALVYNATNLRTMFSIELFYIEYPRLFNLRCLSSVVQTRTLTKSMSTLLVDYFVLYQEDTVTILSIII